MSCKGVENGLMDFSSGSILPTCVVRACLIEIHDRARCLVVLMFHRKILSSLVQHTQKPMRARAFLV